MPDSCESARPWLWQLVRSGLSAGSVHIHIVALGELFYLSLLQFFTWKREGNSALWWWLWELAMFSCFSIKALNTRLPYV